MKKCGNLWGFRIFLFLRLSMLMNLECGVRKQECGITVPGAFKSGLPLHFQKRGDVVRTGGHAGAIRGDGGGVGLGERCDTESEHYEKKQYFFHYDLEFLFLGTFGGFTGHGHDEQVFGFEGTVFVQPAESLQLAVLFCQFLVGMHFAGGRVEVADLLYMVAV